jgi:hypothetical protein
MPHCTMEASRNAIWAVPSPSFSHVEWLRPGVAARAANLARLRLNADQADPKNAVALLFAVGRHAGST